MNFSEHDEDARADRFFADAIGAIEQQLASDETPYVAREYGRLTAAGMSDEEAKEAMARCLIEEMDRVLRTKSGFDEAGYRMSLERIMPEG